MDGNVSLLWEQHSTGLPNTVHAAVVSAPPRQTPIPAMALDDRRSQDSSSGLNRPEANNFLHEL